MKIVAVEKKLNFFRPCLDVNLAGADKTDLRAGDNKSRRLILLDLKPSLCSVYTSWICTDRRAADSIPQISEQDVWLSICHPTWRSLLASECSLIM